MKVNIRRFFILTLVTICSEAAFSQLDNLKYKNEFRVNTGVMHNHIFRITELEESGSLENGTATEFGFTYAYPMDENLWMGIGLSYLKTRNIYNAPVTKAEPGIGKRPEQFEQLSEMVYFPAFIRYDFNRWVGIRFGMSIEIAVSRSDIYNQNGLGFFAAPVIHYQPSEKLDIGIEPMAHLTAMLPIPQEFYQQHFFLTGANAYLAIRF